MEGVRRASYPGQLVVAHFRADRIAFTTNPPSVFVAPINRTTSAKLVSGRPRQSIEMWLNSRCSIEGLWKWMREEVTQHHCHDTLRDLFDACKSFIDEINRDALAIVRRLWPRFDLDPEVEKLGFSS